MRRLLVFLKHPTPGRVKTRLAAAVGPEAAADIYRACVELTLERLRALAPQTTLCVDPPDALEPVRAWLGAGWELRPQIGSTLGKRLADATARAFADGADRIVVIGTDSPWLGAEQIEDAFTRLEQRDAVLGPAEDGGYYLIGLSRPYPALFEGIAWGSEQVLTQTEARARELGLRLASLRRGYDIDDLEDLQRWLKDERRRQTCRS
jgi:rSAM/selenodomain-associated transferase 1